MSLEPETQITDDFDNIFDFIQKKTQSYNKDYLERMKKTVPTKGKGSISFKYQKSEYYLVYQPVGIDDWSIVGIVENIVKVICDLRLWYENGSGNDYRFVVHDGNMYNDWSCHFNEAPCKCTAPKRSRRAHQSGKEKGNFRAAVFGNFADC